METITPPRSAPSRPWPRLRLAGWLLALTPAAFAAYVVAAIATMPVEAAADLTPEQMAEIRPGWVAMCLFWALPLVLAAVGMGQVALALRHTTGRGPATVALGLVAVSLVAILTYLVASLTLLTFTEPRLALSGAHDLSTVMSIIAFWTALVAIILAGIGLRASGWLRRTGLVVAIVGSLYLAADVVTWLPGLTGSVPLAEAGGVPPLVISFLWLAYGIGLLRRRVPSGHAGDR